MLSTTDDLRIDEIKELSTPQEVMREIPRTLTATRVVTAARNAIHAILNGTDDRLLVVVGPCSVHDPVAAVEYATRLAAVARTAFRPARDRDARLFREAAHHGGMEGTDQRSGPRWQLRHQQGPASRPQRAFGREQSRPAGRVPSSSTSRRRNTSPIWWRGRRSARAPRKARFIANSLPDCPARSASRTAPTAMCASPPTR